MPGCGVRVYIPLDRAGLEGLARAGVIPPGRAYAVTSALRESYGSDDIEELEYAAMMAAAESSADPHGRRIVVAADIETVNDADESDVGVVVLEDAVPLSAVASIHVGDDPDDELAWYATQELNQLVSGW